MSLSKLMAEARTASEAGDREGYYRILSGMKSSFPGECASETLQKIIQGLEYKLYRAAGQQESKPPKLDPQLFSGVFVMGNGPSLKLVDFDMLRHSQVATVGMNSAYRFWEGIGFHPDYYICMDTVLIKSHARAIAELARKQRVRSFFLRNEILEAAPELAEFENILWYADVAGRADIPIFNNYYITTGSWAIRWMMYLGFREIGICGIDANYVEIIKEAKPTGVGIQLEITTTPARNRNYFFADYQRAGDVYNIPNDPEYVRKTDKLFHVEALVKANEYRTQQVLACSIVDLSPISTHAQFPRQAVAEFLGSHTLEIVTTVSGDTGTEAALAIFRAWDRNLCLPYVWKLHILFQGDWEGFIARKGLEEAATRVRGYLESGRVLVHGVSARPSWQDVFVYANHSCRACCCSLGADRVLEQQGFFEWLCNGGIPRSRLLVLPARTGDGGSKSRPDADAGHGYVFRPPIFFPPGCKEVYVGARGSDTALIALQRLNSYTKIVDCGATGNLFAYSVQGGNRGLEMKNPGEAEEYPAQDLLRHLEVFWKEFARQAGPSVMNFLESWYSDPGKPGNEFERKFTIGESNQEYGIRQSLLQALGSVVESRECLAGPVAKPTLELELDFRQENDGAAIGSVIAAAMEDGRFMLIRLMNETDAGSLQHRDEPVLAALFQITGMGRDIWLPLLRYPLKLVVRESLCNDAELNALDELYVRLKAFFG